MGKTNRKNGGGGKMPDGSRPSGSSSRSQRQSGPPPREVQVSKKLSWLLRHGADKEGLKLTSGGYANVADILANRLLKTQHVTFEDIKRVVSTNEKKRFGLVHLLQSSEPIANSEEALLNTGIVELDLDPNGEKSEDPDGPSLESTKQKPTPNEQVVAGFSTTEDAITNPDDEPSNYLIRANQGHSIKLADTDDLLTPITLEAGNLPETVVHGTRRQVWPAIVASGGLMPMKRNHVHFATGVPKQLKTSSDAAAGTGNVATLAETDVSTPDVISGMRTSSTLLIFLNLHKALERGIKFWLSENSVVLTAGGEDGVVPIEVFKKVEEQGGRVLVEDGRVVAELKGLSTLAGAQAKKKNVKPKLNTKENGRGEHDLTEG